MLSGLRQAILGGVNHVAKTSAEAVGSKATQLFKPGPATSQLIKRDYHVVATPTVRNDAGKVTQTGHINLRFTPQEQEQHGLPPSMGHVMGRSTPEMPRTQHEVSGQLPNGEPFTVTSHSGPAQISGLDKPLPLSKSSHIDMGELDEPTAKLFKALSERPIFVSYETSGKEGKNCVAATAHILKQAGIHVEPHPHQTPDGYLADLSDTLVKKIMGPTNGAV